MALDFTKLSSSHSVDTVNDPRKIFHALPAKDKKYQYLRDVQEQVLSKWVDRRGERDLLIKMNTGGGKTVLGLLILKACINEGAGPAVYLTPDNYLAAQVMTEAGALGLRTTDDPKSHDYAASKSILVTTIKRLVNGKSVFGVGNEGVKLPIGSVIVDDAHACLASVEEQFTLTFDSGDDFFDELLAEFEDDLRQQSKVGVVDLRDRDPKALMVVPYWAWIKKQDAIIKIILKYKKQDNVQFVWPLIKENLELCRCVFSASRVEISPPCLPIHIIPAFTNANRRLYMTATLSNDGILISDFNASHESVAKPLTPNTASDIGDRMILMPQALNPDITEDEIKELAVNFSKKNNVVVIVPSNFRATYWKDVAKFILTADNLHEGIEHLKKKHVGLVVLVNKYDGIDLPEDACRILILDGLPDVRRLVDKIEQSVLLGSERYLARQVHRIEQGMGRGVRSNEDYCAVFLMGSRLIEQMYAVGAGKYFSEATKAQLELSRKVTEQISGKGVDAIMETTNVLLQRNPEWIKASKGALINLSYPEVVAIDNIVAKERQAFDAALIDRFDLAEDAIQSAIDGCNDVSMQALLLQRLAEYIYQLDPVRSQEVLAAAANRGRVFVKPLKGIAYKKLNTEKLDQSKSAAEFLKSEYDHPNKFRVAVDALISRLQFVQDSWNEFEESTKLLALHFGFESQRPEKEFGVGPDVLWAIGHQKYLVISCKNEATSETISKKYADELSGLMNWFVKSYAKCTAVPVIVHPSSVFDKNAFPPNGTRVISTQKLQVLRDAARNFANAVAVKRDDIKIVRGALEHFRFSGETFVETYTSVAKKQN